MSVVTNTTTITSVGAPSRRNTELALLVFAVLIPVFAYANVGLAKKGSLPAGLLAYGVGLGALAAVAHLMVRKFAPYSDPLMLPIATLLNGMGLVFIWRLDQEPSLGSSSAPTQLLWSTLGIALFVAVLVFLKDHRILQRYTYISMVVALVLLIAPAFFPGVYGAKIWITIAGFSIQPGEFAKIIITVFFAGYLMVKRDALALASRRFMGLYLPRGRDLGPILAVWAISLMILVFETDLGSSLLFFGLFVIMLYVATERTSWIVFGLVLSVGGAVVVGSFESHVHSRVEDWLNPFRTLEAGQGASQPAQAMWAFGSGGIFGSGLGQGYSRLIKFAAKSDYILATVGEELGLAGLMALILLYALLIERGVRTALAARDPFGKLLAIGLSGAFALQVFVVAGGVTGLIPLTGMTMPFLAQGGSSVIANWALVAILLRISDTARRPAPTPVSSPDAEPTQVVRTQ
ncbi:FtsW/RodA/SpoVE family cell cycle protein [Streptomyces sp. NPDC026673]|uniref:FtsW/RodA/SpoVE family cell cycle protein n=1 Tax=Streptomyces sp. NPDC026673 TaxID=3155724 RepID=UPI0033E1E686